MNKPTALTRGIAAALTLVFLGFVFTAFVAMLVNSGGDLLDSVRRKSILEQYEPEDPNLFDRLQAKITSFTAAAGDAMWLKDDFGILNSRFQYALGKRMINTGSQNMVTLTTGHLYDLQPYQSLEGNARDIVELAGSDTLASVPFLFVYEHPTLYDDAMMPEGYGDLDASARMADEVVAALREGGVDVLDSRDVLPQSGHSLQELLMYTDQHWSTLSAILMAQAIAEDLNSTIGTDLDTSLLDLSAFDTVVHEKLFLGKYGQRVGTGVIDPDDIIEYNPKYPTQLSRHTLRVTSIEDVSGDFPTVAVRADRLEPEPGKTWNTYAYTYYGQVEAYNIFTNELAPDCTILVLKDSYSAPIATFLSLVARQVVAVDLRRDTGRTLAEWVEDYQPDAVVMAYSLQMLKGDNYAFGN